LARVRRYKKFEKNIALTIFHGVGNFFKKVGNFFVSLFKFGNRKLTIMVVPHSQSKVINFQTNIFSVITGFIIILGIAGAFIHFNRQNLSSQTEIARLSEENKKTLASFDELRDENNNLLQVAKRFQNSFSQSLSILGIDKNAHSKNHTQNSDLSSLFDLQELSQNSVREAADIRQLTSYLEDAIQPIEQISKMLESQSSLFSDIPSVWPLKNGIGHISMPFGQTVHPITGQWYIHKGLDFSTWRSGDPIISTANGQVVTVRFDNSFGNYVVIKHKHGFYTRYAHMAETRVKAGQYVSQGDVIGTIGNTGISTGPHLHYEVHIGSDVVDPAKYINVKLTK